MSTYVALLRGINVGGHNKVPMKELRELCLELGLENPRTVLASGNLIFDSELKSTARLAKRLEEAVLEKFGVKNPIFVLTATEFRQVLAADPIDPQGRDGNKLMVLFLPQSSTAKAQKDFLDKHTGPELVEFGERAVYLYYSEGLGRSKLNLANTVPAPGTMRNRNTLKKLEELLAGAD